MMLLAIAGVKEVVPLFVFFGIVIAIWAVLSFLSERNSRSLERLQRHSRPASLAEIEDPKMARKGERFSAVTEMAKAISQPMMPQTDTAAAVIKVVQTMMAPLSHSVLTPSDCASWSPMANTLIRQRIPINPKTPAIIAGSASFTLRTEAPLKLPSSQ